MGRGHLEMDFKLFELPIIPLWIGIRNQALELCWNTKRIRNLRGLKNRASLKYIIREIIICMLFNRVVATRKNVIYKILLRRKSVIFLTQFELYNFTIFIENI